MLLARWSPPHAEAVAKDQKALRAAGFTVRPNFFRGMWTLDVEADGGRYKVIYQHAYPEAPPVVIRPSVDEAKVAHRYIETNDVPSAVKQMHADPGYGSGIRSYGSVLLTPSWFQVADGQRGECTFTTADGAFVGIGITGTAREADVTREAVALIAKRPIHTGGRWVRADGPLDDRLSDHGLVVAIEARVAEAFGGPSRDAPISAVVWTTADGAATWVFAVTFADSVLLARGIPLAINAELRAPHAERLADRTIGIIGTGAVGWPVAVSLARAGIRRFRLWDADSVHADNLPRTGAHLRDVGYPKVETLAHEIRAVAPEANIEDLVDRVGIEVGAWALAERHCDLYIDASASSRSPVETNKVSIVTGTPAIYAWVNEDASAARIFRVRPGKSACYRCVQRARPPALPGAPLDSSHPWSGGYPNVELVAAAVTRLALATLLAQPASDHTVVRFVPGRLIPRDDAVHIARDRHCEFCGRGSNPFASARGSARSAARRNGRSETLDAGNGEWRWMTPGRPLGR